MKVELRKLWRNHWMILLTVKRWRAWYRYINLVTARARWPIEFAISDEGFLT